MSSEFEKLKKRHAEEIKQLQDQCIHSELSEWLEYEWAPGHTTGDYVKVCRNCDMWVESRDSSGEVKKI